MGKAISCNIHATNSRSVTVLWAHIDKHTAESTPYSAIPFLATTTTSMAVLDDTDAGAGVTV